MSLRVSISRILARPRSWIRAVSRRARLEGEMDLELAAHVANMTAGLIRDGYSPEEAARRARVALGPMLAHKEEMRASLGLRFWDELIGDLRYSTRLLCKSPGFTLIAVGSLALGIGANTAIFSFAKRVLLDSLPVRDPQQLRLLTWVSGHEQPVPPVWGDVNSTPNGLTSPSFSYPVLEELRKKTDVFEDLIAFKDIEEMTATIDGHAQVVASGMISGNAFEALGVRPVLGRLLMPADDAGLGTGPVAVISEGFWTERFARSPAVVGKTISINGVPITIVGVSAGKFSGLNLGSPEQIFLPLTLQPLLIPRAQNIGSGNNSLLTNPQSWWVTILMRLRPDVPEARAQAALDVVLRQATRATVADVKGMDAFHISFQPGNRGLDSLGGFAEPSYVLLALAGLVLLLACVNVATLLLARGAARQREIATRLALGAGRRRIARQLLTESLLLSVLGGAAGFAIGFLGRNTIPRLFENSAQPSGFDAGFDWKVMAFALAVSMAAGILFGVVPAWHAARSSASASIKESRTSTASRGRIWLGKVLILMQVSLSTVLLVGAILFARTLMNLSHRPLGFREDHILLFKLNPPHTRYTDAKIVALYRQLEEKLAAIPGVRSESVSNIAIMGDGNSGSAFHVAGRPMQKDEPRVQANSVGADFFQTMGIPVLRGRSFNARDTFAAPRVAVVNRALAQKYFPNEDPLGQIFVADYDDVDGPTQIVGVVADTQYADLRGQTPPTYYLPYLQRPYGGRMVVELHTEGDPGSVLSQARAAVESLDRDLPLTNVRTMSEQVRTTMSAERMFALLTAGFGVLALTLACVGIYGVMAYAVTSRTSEIGIRLALGASRSRVLTAVLREASWLSLAGVALGIVGALLCTRLIRSMLFGVAPDDPASMAGAAVLLLVVGLVASWLPAWRAASVEPMVALRCE